MIAKLLSDCLLFINGYWLKYKAFICLRSVWNHQTLVNASVMFIVDKRRMTKV